MAGLSEQEVDALEQVLKRSRPAEPTVDEVGRFAQVASYSATATPAGLGVRFRLRDGTEQQVMLNPVVARLLALAVLYRGEEAGWLDEYGDVITAAPE